VSRPRPAHRCRVCRRELKFEWSRATTTPERAELDRQMTNGVCDRCARLRHMAALEYIAAADRIRLAWQWAQQTYGPDAVEHDPLLAGRPGPLRSRAGGSLALLRIASADERCVELRMWGEAR
jgi:hypothetical protein